MDIFSRAPLISWLIIGVGEAATMLFTDDQGRRLVRYGSGANRILENAGFIRVDGFNSGIYMIPGPGDGGDGWEPTKWAVRCGCGPGMIFDETWILGSNPGSPGWTKREVETWKAARLRYWQGHVPKFKRTGLRPTGDQILKDLAAVGIVSVQEDLDFDQAPAPAPEPEPQEPPTKARKRTGRPPGNMVRKGIKRLGPTKRGEPPGFHIVGRWQKKRDTKTLRGVTLEDAVAYQAEMMKGLGWTPTEAEWEEWIRRVLEEEDREPQEAAQEPPQGPESAEDQEPVEAPEPPQEPAQDAGAPKVRRRRKAGQTLEVREARYTSILEAAITVAAFEPGEDGMTPRRTAREIADRAQEIKKAVIASEPSFRRRVL